VARVAVSVTAILIVAWLGVMAYDAHRQADGVAAAAPPRAAGDLGRADAAFRAARLLNPDSAPDVLRALTLDARGRSHEAATLLSAVVGREPDNINAWGVLYLVARQADPALARQALAARRRLDPVGAGAH
jgi:predicted Zn-dependent protease